MFVWITEFFACLLVTMLVTVASRLSICPWWKIRWVAKKFSHSCAKRYWQPISLQQIKCIATKQSPNCSTTIPPTHQPFMPAFGHAFWSSVCAGSSLFACAAILWRFGLGFFLRIIAFVQHSFWAIIIVTRVTPRRVWVLPNEPMSYWLNLSLVIMIIVTIQINNEPTWWTNLLVAPHIRLSTRSFRNPGGPLRVR